MKSLTEYIYESEKEFVFDDDYKKEWMTADEKYAKQFKVPAIIIRQLRSAMLRGYIPNKENGHTVKYGVSRENLPKVQYENDVDITKETVIKILDQLESDGMTYKFETDAEWQKKGWKNPLD